MKSPKENMHSHNVTLLSGFFSDLADMLIGSYSIEKNIGSSSRHRELAELRKSMMDIEIIPSCVNDKENLFNDINNTLRDTQKALKDINSEIKDGQAAKESSTYKNR